MNEQIKRIKYLRLEPVERFIYDIIVNTTEHTNGDVRYFKYNGVIIYDIKVFDSIKVWDRYTVNGMERDLKVKTHIWCRYKYFWENIEKSFDLYYVDVQLYLNKIMKSYYNLEYPLCEMDASDTTCNNSWKYYE